MRNLKIKSLPNTNTSWVDRDAIMLHACFQILEDYVELEEGLTHCDYEYHKDLIDELKILYDWWQIRKGLFDDDRDNEMLLRLIDKRETLWT